MSDGGGRSLALRAGVLAAMNDNGCLHLTNFKAAKGTEPYKIVHAFFVACTSYEARSYKVRSLLCSLRRCTHIYLYLYIYMYDCTMCTLVPAVISSIFRLRFLDGSLSASLVCISNRLLSFVFIYNSRHPTLFVISLTFVTVQIFKTYLV